MLPYPSICASIVSMTTTQTQPTSQKISDEEIASREAETSRLKAAGYDAVDNMSDAEFSRLPEDWEDKITEDAYNEVWGSWEAYEEAVNTP